MRVRLASLLATFLLASTLVAAACGSSASPEPSASAEPQPSASAPSAPSGSAAPPSAMPSAPPTGAPPSLGSERLNILLAGIDDTTEREISEHTDTMIVASLDPVGGTVSLLGLPRDLTDFPLPSGAIYRDKLNGIYLEVQGNPGRFGGTAGEEPLAVIARVVGNIVDLPLEHWAAVDMDGFAALIDELGGIDIYVERAICDAGYRQLGLRGFEVEAGWWHMSGPQALAFSRIRKDAGGSDFQRMRRQQDVLVAIREAVVASGATDDPLGWLARVPAIRSDLPPETILAAGAAIAGIPGDRFHSRLIQPFGRGGTELTDERGYVLSANLDEIREASGLLFTTPGKRPTTGRQDPPPDKPAAVPDLPAFNGC